MPTSKRSGRGTNVVTATSMSRMVVPSMAFVAAMALVFAIQHVRREPPVDIKAATDVPAVPKPASGAQDQGQAALAAAQAKANAEVAALAGSPLPPDSDDGLPGFDIARIEPTGEAVIAGRATPGATVELLRNGELHDSAVADQSGQFVMVPPRLPSGTYDLTLRAKQPDGKQATSKQSVAVALEPTPNDRPVVALMTPDKPTVVLSQPAAPKPMAGAVVVEAVETEPGGKLHVSGQARPGGVVRLYLNDSFVASVTAGVDGRFAVTINGGVAPGGYRVRLDEVEFEFRRGARTCGSAVQRSRHSGRRVPASAGHCVQTVGHCSCTAAATGGRGGDRSTRRRLAHHRGRAENRDHHCLSRRQPLASQPPHLRGRHSLCNHLQGEPGAYTQSQPDLSWPDLCPSDAVMRGHGNGPTPDESKTPLSTASAPASAIGRATSLTSHARSLKPRSPMSSAIRPNKPTAAVTHWRNDAN